MSTPESKPIISGPGEGSLTVDNLTGGRLTFKARAADTGGALTFFETIVKPGEGPPLHLHREDEEFLYFIEGQFRVRLGDDVHEAPAGSLVFIPKGTVHTWTNAGDTAGRLLAVFTPAAPRMEAFFESAATLSAEARADESFATFAADAGMEVLGPPL
jgi:quercetin dioxygenase-like cupin family protein